MSARERIEQEFYAERGYLPGTAWNTTAAAKRVIDKITAENDAAKNRIIELACENDALRLQSDERHDALCAERRKNDELRAKLTTHRLNGGRCVCDDMTAKDAALAAEKQCEELREKLDRKTAEAMAFFEDGSAARAAANSLRNEKNDALKQCDDLRREHAAALTNLRYVLREQAMALAEARLSGITHSCAECEAKAREIEGLKEALRVAQFNVINLEIGLEAWKSSATKAALARIDVAGKAQP